MAPKSHKWEPITDLPENWRALDEPETAALATQWIRREAELRGSESYKSFYTKLHRRFAIETGAIERIYHISRSATETLIERGLDAAFLMHGDTEEPTQLVVDRIRDQYDAIGGLLQFVSDDRALSRSYICELHQTVTRNQKTYKAFDSLGNAVERPLVGGELKKWANNVEDARGFRFEFCPPLHVESELDRLVEMHREHMKKSASPIVEAAWLHHRFVLIHPFPDGNGRVARLLATLVLLKGRLLPLVVENTPEDVGEYIDGLRAADDGYLEPLVRSFGRLQRRELRNALSVAEVTIEDSQEVSSIVERVKSGLLEKERHVSKNMPIALPFMLDFVRDEMESTARAISEALAPVNPKFNARCTFFSPEESLSKLYKRPVYQCARALGYFADITLYHACALLTIKTHEQVELLVSFHRLGHGPSGVLTCATMMFDSLESEVVALCDEPFGFVDNESDAKLMERFEVWFRKSLQRGLMQWKDRTL